MSHHKLAFYKAVFAGSPHYSQQASLYSHSFGAIPLSPNIPVTGMTFVGDGWVRSSSSPRYTASSLSMHSHGFTVFDPLKK